MMVQCVMCPEGKCPKDCPTVDVLPFEGPLKEESIRKGRKLQATGMEIKEIKERLKAAGGVDAKNELIKKWMDEYDAKEKDPLFHIIKNRTIIKQQKKLLDKKRKILADGQNLLESARAVLKASRAVYEEAVSNDEGAPASVVDDESAPVADDEGLPGLKKCSTLLDGTSPMD